MARSAALNNPATNSTGKSTRKSTTKSTEAARLVDTVARLRRQAVARAIEDAALDLFAERPMSQVTVEEIAARAGVAVRTLYRYFGTKEQVFAAMLQRGSEAIAVRMAARPVAETPFDALRAATIEVAHDIDDAELHRWINALAKSGDAYERIVGMGLVSSIRALTEALRERVGAPDDDAEALVAGTMAAAAAIAGTVSWIRRGGEWVEHQLVALDVAGAGLRSFGVRSVPSARPARRRR